MPQIDSLLRIVVTQNADELRLGSDKSPSMFAGGAPKRLAVPAMPTSMLLDLFGPILDPSRLAILEHEGRLDVQHQATGLGTWRVQVTRRAGGELAFDAIFSKASEKQPSATPRPEPHNSGGISTASASLGAETSKSQSAPVTSQPRSTPAEATKAMPHLLRSLLTRAVALGASDLHLADGEIPRARVDGALRPVDDLGPTDIVETFSSMLGDRERQRLDASVSCDLAFDVPNGGRARMNLYRSSLGLAAAIRFLPPRAPALAELGFPVNLADLAMFSQGLVIATGATGSGKSTTLAAIASEALQRRSIVAVTLEDPIEYTLAAPNTSLVRQRQIGRDVSDFHTGLRDALREDPDVLLVGEMRDFESISLALTAAETGHLVLASMHSRSAASAIDRIVDACPADRQPQVRLQLAESLRAVISQRLLPRASGPGRVLAAEVLRCTPAVSTGIREGKTGVIRSAIQSGREQGMIPLERHLVDLAQVGHISWETARQTTSDRDALAEYGGPRAMAPAR